MTKEEILGIATGQAAALENANALLNRFNQPAAVPEQRNRFDFDVPDDQYVEGRHVNAILRQLANQPTPTDPVARQLAAQGLLSAIRMERADEFKRWGNEINGEIQKLPPEYWTVDNLNTLVNVVKSRHIDELVTEKARLFADESHPTIRSGSGGSGGVSPTQLTLSSDRLPKSWVDKAKAMGVDEHTVREFCQVTGQTEDQYLAEIERYGKNGVVRG